MKGKPWFQLGVLSIIVLLASGCETVLPYQASRPTQTALYPVQRQIANVTQEVEALEQRLGQLELELEAQVRARKQWQQQLAAYAERQEQLQTAYADLRQSLERQIARLEEADQQQTREIIAEVSRQITKLNKQVLSARSTTQKQVAFSDDYPEQGVVYTVNSGDTLSEIARKLNARVQDIQNANRIADPKRLQIGQTLFIPQATENNL